MDCPSTYIGQTKQYLNKRIYNHKYSINNDVNGETALSKHAKQFNHKFNFDDTKILVKENNYRKRLLLEMVNIKKDKNAINFKTDIENLSFLYNGLLSE